MPLKVKVSGVWKSSYSVATRVAGAWKPIQQIYTKVSGIWKPTFVHTVSVGSFGSCSVSCGGGTQTRTVRCLRDGTVVDNGYCTRSGLSLPSTSQACNTHSCAICEYNDTHTGSGTRSAYSVYSPASSYSGKTNSVYFRGLTIYAQGGDNGPTHITIFYVGGYMYTKGSYMSSTGVLYNYQACRTPV